MKRCPQCSRVYADDGLNYCLDDGTALHESTASDAETVAFQRSKPQIVSKSSSRPILSYAILIIVGLVLVSGAVYWYATRGAGPVASAKHTPVPAAYDGYVKAKVLLSNENKDDVDSAIQLLEQAVKDDPKFAGAFAQLARADSIKSFYFSDVAQQKQLNQDAGVAIEKALTLDPDLAEAHFARGLQLWSHANRFQHEQAAISYKRAIELDPKLDDAHHQLGLIYLHVGLFDKANAEIGKALEINAANTLARFRYGVIDLYQGKYEDAYNFFETTPNDKQPSLRAFQLGTALFKLGRVEEASALIDKYLAEYPADPGGVGTSVKAMILAKQGRDAEAESMIKRSEEIGHDFGHFHHTAFNIASAYAMLKKPDLAVDYLQMAADDGFPCYPLFENDEVFKNMKSNPRYIALLAKLKQQWDRYNATL